MKKKNQPFRIEDISKDTVQWTHIENEDLMPLPPPLDDKSREPEWRKIPVEVKEGFECSLDDTLLLNLPKPKTEEEEKELVR